MRLKELYEIEGKTVVTAHRGWSGRYPENTLTAFNKAVEFGVDVVEFDVHETSDGELVIIHDSTLERTTNGTGRVEEKTLAELKTLNASFWSGPHDTGHRLAEPAGQETIPTLEETFACVGGRVGLNIQVVTRTPDSLREIVRLYVKFDLYETGFLMLGSFAAADYVRGLDPKVAICVGEERENLQRHLQYGVDFVQPMLRHLSDDYVRQAKAARARANIFYGNTHENIKKLLALGLPGIMSDCPDILTAAIRKSGSESTRPRK